MELSIDVKVIAGIRKGDPEAFRQLVSLVQKSAYFHALALTRNHDDATDLAQQCLIRTWRYRKSIDPARPFYPWFYTMMKRLAYNMQRDNRRRKSESFSNLKANRWLSSNRNDSDHSGSESWLEPVAAGNPATDMIRREENQLLADALARLENDDREIIVLKDLEGYKYREISVLLEIPAGTVMSRLYTARKRLKFILEEAGYEIDE